MDAEIAKLVDADTPKLNPLICNGIATEHMKKAEEYVDSVLRSAAKGFPEGLVYLGSERCTPEEELRSQTKRHGTKQLYDTARSDIYTMKYKFEYKGVRILPDRLLALPFVSDANTITISGSKFNIAPILSDRVISIGVNNIFVRLLRDKLTFERSRHDYMINDKRETVQVSWSSVYHKTNKTKKLRQTVKANSTLMHYLLCRYGFTDTFQIFGKCKPIVGGAEININTYPEDTWVICSSTQIKPKGCGRGYYEPTHLRVAVRIEELTPMVKNMLGGFFYIVDHFPSRIKIEFIDSRRLWMVLLGFIIFSGTVNEGILHDDVEDHIKSLDEYLDSVVMYKLKDIGINVTDIYQLFALIIEKFNDWILESAGNVSSMYDKELSVLYYVLYEITSAIFKLYFKLKAVSKKELTAKEIVGIMNMFLKTGLAYSIVKPGHGEVSTVNYSGDNKVFKSTSLLKPQSESSKLTGRKDRAVMRDPTKFLHVSVAEIGGYSNLPKSEPSGRSRINPCVRLDERSMVLRNPKFKDMLDEIQKIIAR